MATEPSPAGAPARRPRLLFYAMYDVARPSNAPRVRIRSLSAALARRADLTLVAGDGLHRLGRGLRLVASGDLFRVDGVYVEPNTTALMPWDVALLLLARAAGRPVGIYFRDAYQLFGDIYPARGWRARLSGLAWRASVAIMRRLATTRYAPSQGLASILHLRSAVLLPPGTDPATPDLGSGSELLVGYVGALNPADGFDRLIEAMRLVREELPEARLRAVGPLPAEAASLPDWVEVRHETRDGLAAALAPARVCVIPRPINRYTDLARPVKLVDYLAFGKPVVATAAAETSAVLDGSGAGLVVGDDPAGIAGGLLRVLREPGLAEEMARAARTLACRPEMTWDNRAERLLSTLLEPAATR